MTKVVVTGMGAICSHGETVPQIWEALLSGASRLQTIDPTTHFDVSKYSRSIKSETVVAASKLSHTELATRSNVDRPQRYDRHQLFALIAATEAFNSLSGERSWDATRFGCIVGTGDGGLEADHTGVEKLLADQRLDPYSNIRELPNLFAGMLANRFELQGPNYVHCTACAASLHAIMHAADQIKLGRADMMLAGGAEAAITPFGIASFTAQRALGTDSRPYQTSRDGFVMGEGAAMLVLESEEHARKRGATVLGELSGYASTGDGNTQGQITDPDPRGGERSATLALQMANLAARDVDAIVTHGTATQLGDVAELQGIKAWAGECAYDLPIIAPKSHVGHLLGAAGAISSVITLQMLAFKKLIATRGLTAENIDPACSDFLHIMSTTTVEELRHVLVNAFGFGGTNGSLVFSVAQKQQ